MSGSRRIQEILTDVIKRDAPAHDTPHPLMRGFLQLTAKCTNKADHQPVDCTTSTKIIKKEKNIKFICHLLGSDFVLYYRSVKITPYKFICAKCISPRRRQAGENTIINDSSEGRKRKKEDHQMRFKRAGSAIMAAVMAASSMGIYAFAAEDEAMKKELTYVKQRLDIPEEYTHFQHNTYTSNGRTSYRFTWDDPNDIYGRTMSVQITGKVITSIYVYNEDMYTYQNSFAKMSASKLKAAAKKYIKQINPSIAKQTVIDEDSLNIALWSSSATLRFHREVNGVPVTGQTGYVTVNKDTGALMGYSFNWIMGATFSKKEDAISVDKAKESYEKYIDSDLLYTVEMEYDEETRLWKHIPHLMYRQQKNGQINAFTGLLSTYEDYRSYEDEIGDDDDDDDVAIEECADSANPTAGGDAKVVSFTEEEKANLEKEASLITADDALKSLEKLGVFYIPDSSSVTWQNCNYDRQKGYYIRNVSFSTPYADYIDLNNEDIVKPLYRNEGAEVSGGFTINAETGDVLSFYNFSQDTGDDLTEKKAEEKAANAMKVLLGDKKDKFGKLEQASESHISEVTDQETGKVVPGTPRTTQRRYTANREEYGIKCDAESLSLTVGNSGYITNYSVIYYDDITYPKPDNILSKSDAYKKFFEQVDIGLKYRCAYNTKEKKVVTALVYAADDQLRIDAFTGKAVNYNGGEIDLGDTLKTYKDIENSKYKKYAEKLASYGITLMNKDGELSEEETITAGDLIELMQKIGLYVNINDPKSPVNLPKESDKLDRRTAAKLLVIAKYGYELPEMKSMFKSPFSDVKDGSDYVGYITIADASGLLKGSKGKYSPKKALTRGAALMIAYNYLAK